MAELYGKQEGSSGGRGGSMHIFDTNRFFYGGNAIVAGGLPVAVGLALADLPSPAAAALAGLIASPLETGERPPAFDLGAAAGVESPAKKARVGCAAGGGGGRARRARLVG